MRSSRRPRDPPSAWCWWRAGERQRRSTTIPPHQRSLPLSRRTSQRGEPQRGRFGHLRDASRASYWQGTPAWGIQPRRHLKTELIQPDNSGGDARAVDSRPEGFSANVPLHRRLVPTGCTYSKRRAIWRWLQTPQTRHCTAFQLNSIWHVTKRYTTRHLPLYRRVVWLQQYSLTNHQNTIYFCNIVEI
jgi:hypothetical protein